MANILNQAQAVVIGHAVGDALGVPVEFRPRSYLKQNPVTDMTGFGTHPVPKGAWSDDTSMSLCALASLAHGIDFDGVMQNFVSWYNNGDFTATGETFDVGMTCTDAIFKYHNLKQPYNKCGVARENSNGNGSLMRIHPHALYAFDRGLPQAERIKLIHTASSLTHAHERSQVACGIYSFVLWELLEAPCKTSVAEGLKKAKEFYSGNAELGAFSRLFDNLAELDESEIESGGYVVHTLEASLWCLLTTKSYGECVLKAVNLGADTDTTGAVAGGLAGALYGLNAIPEKWRKSLLRADYIEELCRAVFK